MNQFYESNHSTQWIAIMKLNGYKNVCSAVSAKIFVMAFIWSNQFCHILLRSDNVNE